MKPIQYTDLHPEVFGKMTRQGAFLTAKGKDGRVNTMTIGWAEVGWCWSLPIFTCFVRESRYTDELLRENPVFTVSVPKGDELDKALAYCGTRSGRDSDKFASCSLTPVPGREVDCPIVGEAWLHYECRIVGKSLLNDEALDSAICDKHYRDHDWHTAYFGEILACYTTDQP